MRFSSHEWILIRFCSFVFPALAERRKTYAAMPIVDCYSCMSRSYEQYWSVLQHTYYAQRNFTHLCDEENFDARKVPTVPCRHICVTIIEPNVVGGVVVSKQFIRGCYDRILRAGFNESAIENNRFRSHDQCRSVDRLLLFKLRELYPGQVTMCSCFANRCNGSPPISATSSNYSSFATMVALWFLVVMAAHNTIFVVAFSDDCRQLSQFWHYCAAVLFSLVGLNVPRTITSFELINAATVTTVLSELRLFSVLITTSVCFVAFLFVLLTFLLPFSSRRQLDNALWLRFRLVK